MSDFAQVTYTARCPACKRDCEWTAKPVSSRFNVEIRYRIDCDCDQETR